MRTYTLSAFGGNYGVTEYRAKSPETLARRIYGSTATVTYRQWSDGTRDHEWWEVFTWADGVPTWVDDIFLA